MKNTVQVRKNGATKRAPAQTKTSRHASSAESQTLRLITCQIDEARAAKAQSSSLHWLLSKALFNQEDGTYGEEIQFGITELIFAAHSRMDRALASLEMLAESKEVAS